MVVLVRFAPTTFHIASVDDFIKIYFICPSVRLISFGAPYSEARLSRPCLQNGRESDSIFVQSSPSRKIVASWTILHILVNSPGFNQQFQGIDDMRSFVSAWS
jgi:hypothetical protein